MFFRLFQISPDQMDAGKAAETPGVSRIILDDPVEGPFRSIQVPRAHVSATQPAEGDRVGPGIEVGGPPVTQTFVIENTGTGDLTLTGPAPVTVTGTDFSVTLQPAVLTLAPGASTSFEVQFAPAAVGFSQATVDIASDDLDESLYTFSLLGIGEAASADVGQVFIVGSDLASSGGPDSHVYRFNRDGVADGQFHDNAVLSSITTDGTSLFVAEGGKPVGILHMHDCLRAGVV